MIHSQPNESSDSTEVRAFRYRERPPNLDHSAIKAESSMLARELARGFGEKVEEFRKYCNLSPQEARQYAAQNSPQSIDRILKSPPDELRWCDLDVLARKDPALVHERWETIKQAASDEIHSGYRAAQTVEDGGGPLERARFLTVRAELMGDWQPRNATEQMLVDQLAQLQILSWRWLEAFTTWTNHARIAPRKAKKGESYETMRVWESEALERAGRKVELLQRMYLRTLKALQDLRRPRRKDTLDCLYLLEAVVSKLQRLAVLGDVPHEFLRGTIG